jgi:pimeloyl-ACP methyl ester carboxylesterase
MNAARYQTTGAFLGLLVRGVLDALGGLVGRRPLLVPLSGPPGTVAMLTTPDAQDGEAALDPGGEHAGWIRAVAARSTLGVGFYRPGRDAGRIRCPLLVVVCDEDRSALAEPAVRAAEAAPAAELVRLPGGHYAPFLDAHEQAVAAELDFLRRHLIHPHPVG